jgi:serine protease
MVALRIGKSSGGDLGTVQVVVIDTDSGSAIVTATATASADDEYNYRIGLVDAGSFRITASTDTNGDEVICEDGEACGRFGGLTNPVVLEAAESTEDVDIVVRLPAEP